MNAITVIEAAPAYRHPRRKPPPPGFAESFVRWGWRGVEAIFGARTPCNVRWVEECGGEALKEQRRQYQIRLRELSHVRAA